MTQNSTSESARGLLIDAESEGPDFFSAFSRLEHVPHHVRRFLLNGLRDQDLKPEILILCRTFDEIELTQRNRTVVVLLDSDEDGLTVGPSGFKRGALAKLFSGACAILLNTGDVGWNPYASITELAIGRSRYVVIVESGSECEPAWRAEIEPHRKHAACVFGFGKPFEKHWCEAENVCR